MSPIELARADTRTPECREVAILEKPTTDHEWRTMAVMAYTTQDRLAHYGFSIEFRPDAGWRVYIAFLPCQGSHDENSFLPYLSIDRDKRRYVNWSARIDSLGEARTVAELWAEITQSHLRADAPPKNNDTPTKDPGSAQHLRPHAA